MSLSNERLQAIVSELAARPKHEKVRALVYDLLVNGLDAHSTELDFERPTPEVHGRIDALLGRTVFEFKSDLRRELRDAEAELTRYLAQRQTETGEHFVGVATDGATFIPFELRDGELRRFQVFDSHDDDPHGLLAWLGSVVSVSAELEPTAEVVTRELGRSSLAWNLAKQELAAMWASVVQQPDVRLKRDLWGQLMRRVYGTALNEDTLFLQHTYLTIVAKTMAAEVLGVPVEDPADLLSGRHFQEHGINGMVESDFFDWPLARETGKALVKRISLQAARFKLEDVASDVLKGLYESLIDQEQRHFLGEYYTPDWLAERVCAETIKQPLGQRVLDPACGSGTFVFHSVKRLMAAAESTGLASHDAIELACQQITGIDTHPVAVQIARVTFLLAIGRDRLRQRPGSLSIPIYIGDSLQWNTSGFMAERDVSISVPSTGERIEFPFEVTRDPILFDAVIDRMLLLSRQGGTPAALTAWLGREYPLNDGAVQTLLKTYAILHKLHTEGRDHIWGFVARNLIRPIWLAQQDQRVDVVVGNPPWLAYRYMDREMQERFRKESVERGLWVGGKVATHQDLSAYFFVRCVELYLRADGVIALVMPYAAMTRRQFVGFRTGAYGQANGKGFNHVFANIRFIDAWVFSDEVQPLFPVPSCVLFAQTDGDSSSPLPRSTQLVSSHLPKRDSDLDVAMARLTWREMPWPVAVDPADVVSLYSGQFKNGATIFPRVLCVVEMAPAPSFFGPNPIVPVIQSRRSRQEKEPWKSLPSLRGNVEHEFLRPLYLGESIAPYRMLESMLAVIPWNAETGQLMDSQSASLAGHAYVSRWLADAEGLWKDNGRPGLSFRQQLDYYGKLTAQFPIPSLRVVFAASGTLPAAALLSDLAGVVEHSLYWTAVRTQREGRYLLAILNSETARKEAEDLQARGQWGARHFDKVMLSLSIPPFDPSNELHRSLAGAAAHAERVASLVPLDKGVHFIKARQKVRAALRDDGVAQKIDDLVAQLLHLSA